MIASLTILLEGLLLFTHTYILVTFSIINEYLQIVTRTSLFCFFSLQRVLRQGHKTWRVTAARGNTLSCMKMLYLLTKL